MKTIDLEEMKKIELKMLEYVDNICRTNNINYFLYGGSLIGAVRHHGIIPWDDDIDIGLLRNDYDKLLDILKNDKNNQYKLFDNSIQSDYYFPFAKIVDTKTTLVGENLKQIKDYGVYLDIFPFDMLPDNEKERNKIYKKTKRNQRKIFYWIAEKIKDSNFIKRTAKNIIKIYCEIIGIKKILKKHNKICTKYNGSASAGYVISCWPLYKKNNEIQKLSDFNEFMDYEFDGLTVKIPVKYDEILTTAFGDYMTPPPVEKRSSRHDVKCYWKEDKDAK